MKTLDSKVLDDVLDSMRLPNGAYQASLSASYSYVWVRDVCYTVLPYLRSSCGRYEQAYLALFALFRKYEWKIDIHREKKPIATFEYIHARYSLQLEEMDVPWGHAQHDAIGLFLWGVGEGIRHGKNIIRDERDRDMIQKLVDYLGCVEYWQDPDNGMWEEYKELHASSVGACVAGLQSVQEMVHVPPVWIQKGQTALERLLPRESDSKETDLSLLSLIYPYKVVSQDMAVQILELVTQRLERKYGCIRYEGDQYFNEGQEAEWCFGFPWLGLCYLTIGRRDQADTYWQKTKSIILGDGRVPELYVGGTDQPNENTPLAWAVAMVKDFAEQLE